MPSSSQPPKRSWRDDASGGRGGATKREWQKEPGGPGAGGPRLSKRMKIILAVTSLLAVVVGVVVLWLLLHRPDPPRVVLIGAGYETNPAVPHNVYGKRGLADLKAWAEQNKSPGGEHSVQVVMEKQLDAEGDPFGEALNGCTSKKVVIFVAVHGGASGQGAYLIPNNAGPRATGGYPMAKLYAALEQLPKDTQKLLILDTTQVTADWHLGMLHNDFVRALANDPRPKAIDNLLILCASDEDQRSWVSEEYGQTIFAHFVIEGLKGAADKDNDGEVTAQELISYVKKQVESWVRHNRDALQTPRVLGAEGIAEKMGLATAERSAYEKTKPDPAKLPKWSPPKAVVAAWEERDELAGSFPHPATYTPHLWRQYHDALLRFEQLTRAGDATNAEAMEQKLRNLAGKIRQNQRIEKDTLAATLATPAALGWSLPDKDEQKIQQEFNALWSGGAKPDEFGRALKEWQASAGGDSNRNHLVRVRVDALLLERAAGSEADFKRVCDILPKVDDELAPRRPAEAHFALMMNRFVPDDNREWKRLRGELLTRVYAEQAALGLPRTSQTTPESKRPEPVTPYSEQLLPWVKKDVEAADKARRLREDLLFASPRETARLGDKIEDADTLYKEVQQRANEVRKAIRLRDDVLADLPYYTLWLARTLRTEDEEKPCLDTWDATHQLCRLLDEPKPEAVNALKEPTQKIRFKEIAADFEKAYTDQLTKHSTTQADWRRLQELLAVPLIPAAERAKLLGEWGRIGFELNASTEQAEERPGLDKEQNSQFARSLAQRQGRFAVRFHGIDSPGAKELEQIVTRPGGDWQGSLDRAGDQLAAALNKQSRDAFEDTDKGRKAPLSDAGPLLRTAALRARFAPAAAVAAWPTLDPVGENRAVQMYELMKWQAERTFADYWAAYPEDVRNPYYRTAAKLYVDAAKWLAVNDKADLSDEQKEGRLGDLASLEKALAAADRLAFKWRDGDDFLPGPATLPVTDEERVKRVFGLDCPASMPPGFPVVWEELGRNLKPAGKDDLGRRALENVAGKGEGVRVEYELVPERPPTPSFTKEKTKHTLEGFYRGRRFSLDTAVTLHHLPEVVSYGPELPPTARIAVQASKEDYDRFAAQNSELVIVVDYSKSMRKTVKGIGKSRKDVALDALEACLKKIPNGVRVTILTFSADTDELISKQWGGPWNDAAPEVAKRMKQLRALTPMYNTPLVRATVEARKHFSEDFKKGKTLVILTDGGDNSFHGRGPSYRAEEELRDRYGATMDKCLKAAFKDQGVSINVVGFRLSELDPKEDADEIEGLKEYRPAVEKIGGVFKDAEDTAALAEYLERSILQIHFNLDSESGRVPPGAIPEEGADVSRRESNFRWIRGLEPGTYKIVLQANRVQKAFEQRVRVERGDSLILQLVPSPDGKGFQFRRKNYVDSSTIQKFNSLVVHRDLKDISWMFSVVQNQQIANKFTRDAVQMMAVIEKRDDQPLARNVAVQQVRPRHVWYQVTTEENPDKMVPGLRFYPLADYPAPCYSLDIGSWPLNARGRLEVWWNEDVPPDCGILRRTTGTKVTEMAPRSMEVRPTDQSERTRIVIESIQQERRDVEVRPGEPVKKDVDCLVVRLRYDVKENKKPFFVELPEGVADGYEHRFYTEAGKYTGVFWNVSKEKADKLEFIKIYSVEGAHRTGHHLDPLPLGAPNTEARPQKPGD
jgi:hypothetical protein